MNQWEKQYVESGFASQRKYPNEALVRFIMTQTKLDDSILELGCGSGANLWFIAKENRKAYGIDYAKTGIELCKKMLKKWETNGYLKVGDITKGLPYSDHSFDSIVDIVTMQHLTIKEHQIALKEVYRCLKQEEEAEGGGRFFSWHLGSKSHNFLANPNKKIDEFTIENIPESMPLSNNGIVCFLSPLKYQELLIEAGFKNINIEITTRTYDNRKVLLEYLEVIAS